MKAIMFILAAAVTLTLAGCDIEVDAQSPPRISSGSFPDFVIVDRPWESL